MSEKLTVLYHSEKNRGFAWQSYIKTKYPHIHFYVWPEIDDLSQVEVLVIWKVPEGLIEKLPNLKTIFTVSAGIDQINFETLPAHVDVIRMIDSDLSDQLAEYSLMSVLMLHRQAFEYLNLQSKSQWTPISTQPAHNVTIGIMGLGQQGQKIIQRLKPFGFNLRGWSKSQHSIDNVACYNEKKLKDFLFGLDILICVLPLTWETKGILNNKVFSAVAKGCSIINIGRGEHIIIDDLIENLNSGQLHRAVLDVMEDEPLNQSHPIWQHPKVMITPHIAGSTRPESGYQTFIKSLLDWHSGLKPAGFVSKNKGY